MSGWLEAWMKNSKTLSERYGITISAATHEGPQAVQTDPNGAIGDRK